MQGLRIEIIRSIRLLGLAAAIAIVPQNAFGDTIYRVSESGVFSAGTPTTPESAPGAAFRYTFLISATPAINFVTNFGGPDCGFDAVFSNFNYTLNGVPVALSGPDVQLFGYAPGVTGSADISPDSNVDEDNFYLVFANPTPAFTNPGGDFLNPILTLGTYQLDPTQSIFQPDFNFSDGTPISGELVISQTPEPSGLLLMATGLVGLAGGIKRRLRR